MRILIAGAAGFIGSHLSEGLLRAGHQVVGVDNFVTGRRENLADLLGSPGFTFLEHDVAEPLPVEEPLDAIYHLASPASPNDYLKYPIETLRVGSEGTRNLLEASLAHGARFLLASTSECYGDPLEHPQRETYWGNVNPVGPRSCYDEAKRYAEALTMAYFRRHGLRTNIARIFNTYGPRMKLDDGRVVPQFIDLALRSLPLTVYGDGRQTRSFCYISDLVEGLTRLASSDERYPVNLGNPVEVTILEFANRILELTGGRSTIEYRPLPEDDPKRRKPDIDKARRVLGWQPEVSLDDGLRQTIRFFQGLTP